MVKEIRPSVNYERFPSQYFSGCDIRVYFDNSLIDEVTDLQFALEEKVLPLQGYNSYTYDSVARGSRVIQGTFVINFKETDYIRKAIKQIIEQKQEPDRQSWRGNYPVTDKELNQSLNDVKESNLEQKVNQLYNYAERGFDKKFSETKEQLEESIWGQAQEQTTELPDAEGPYFEDDDIGFDIVITYGAYKRDDVYQVEKEYSNTVNPGTVESINNVQIMSVNKMINSEGEDIKEQYSFLANDLNRRNNE